MKSNINSVLTYTNPMLLKRYTKDYPNNTLSAGEALHELLNYLWLCHQYSIELNHCEQASSLPKFTCAMYEEMSDIDDMWHTFILHTKDYMDFCHNYFGHFIHHLPLDEISLKDSNIYEEELYYYLHFIYDRLGETTVKKWFQWKECEYNSF